MEDLLWHYTTAAGVLGILDSNEIWASNIQFMNDASENRHLYDLVGQRAEKILSQEESEQSAAEFRRKYNATQPSGRGYFVASFSKVRDSLSQWRAYGLFSIGFSKEELLKLNFQPDVPTSHGDIPRYFGQAHYYSEGTDHGLIERLARSAIADSKHIDHSLIDYSSEEMRWLWLKVKHESFMEEREWRLICAGLEDYIGVNYRPGPLSIVPYLKVSLGELTTPIREILVGPSARAPLDALALRSYRDARHLQFEVTESRIPFRNW